jgi:transposase
MNDKSLYQKLLGLTSPWEVVEVTLDTGQEEVQVQVDLEEKTRLLPCPECQQPCPIYDHRDERAWRHLDSCGFQTWLLSSVPRVNCSDHGILTVETPWSVPYSRWTLAFESFALWLLQATQCQAKAARLLRVSEDQLREVMKQAVERGLSRRDPERAVPHVTLDETSQGRGLHYLTIVGAEERVLEAEERVLEVVEEHSQNAAETALKKGLSEEQRSSVETVTMDMWRAFEAAREAVLPQAETVYDRFHLAADLNEAVDQTRRREHRLLSQTGNTLLKGTQYLWLHAPEHLSEKQRRQLETLKKKELETVKVWSLKEAFRSFFNCQTVEEGNAFFQNWEAKVRQLGNEALLRVSEQLKTHWKGVVAYLRHRVTNASAEGLNSQIQTLKATARGFRNPSCFRRSILFFFGHLDLYPQTSL